MSSASTRFLKLRKGGSLARLISIPHDNVSALSGASDQKPEAYSSIGAGCQYYSAIQIKQTSHNPSLLREMGIPIWLRQILPQHCGVQAVRHVMDPWISACGICPFTVHALR
jgi:hypothetical protein